MVLIVGILPYSSDLYSTEIAVITQKKDAEGEALFIFLRCKLDQAFGIMRIKLKPRTAIWVLLHFGFLCESS